MLSRIPHLYRVSAFYFWLMGTTALATPYLAIWLSGRGLTEQQIGFVNAAPFAAVLAFNLIVGRVADLLFTWRTTIVAGVTVAALTPLGLLFADRFWIFALCWLLVLLPVHVTIPVTDAASARIARREGRSYADIRVWATIGHMLITAGSGFVIGAFGIAAFLPLLFLISGMRLLTGLALPEMRRAETAGPETGAPPPAGMAQFRRAWFVLPLLAAATINASHLMQNAFGALYWAQAGLSSGQIGLLWATATASEIVLMFSFGKLSRLASARWMLAAAGIVAAIRWAGLALEPGFWVLAGLQVLHMFSFGLSYLATIAFVVNWTDDAVAARAQSIVSVMRQSMAAVVLIGFGALAERAGASAYFAASALSLVAVALVLGSLWLMPPNRLERTPA
ncbi:MFS transporter [Pseudoruegeria sp. HB172150]|uniref:MFS transporter n=1 Tax=Pseudoruegeria sp. HB172150 TaxID=2721164 RepID=UPI001C12D545|nr:MFS transporter [Pseudoruegeria sp. HB172150]